MGEFLVNTKVVGGGNQAGQNVFRIRVTAAPLAGAPILEAYSAAGTPPTLTVDASNDDATFSTSDSSVYAVPTNAGDPGADWASSVPTSLVGSPTYVATGVKLQGATSALILTAPAVVSFPIGFTAGFNWCYRLGPNSVTTVGANAHVLALRFIYTGGVPPVILWEANDSTSGSEPSPTWNGLSTPVAKKVIHADSGSIATNPVMTKPTSLPKLFSGDAVIQNA